MFSSKDKEVLRKLASRIKGYSALPVMKEREKMWTNLNDLNSHQPLVLVSPEGAWVEINKTLPLECEGEEARNIERSLRCRLYQYEQITDDSVMDASFRIGWHLSHDGFGVEIKHNTPDADRGAFKHVPPITDIDEGLKKLKFRKISVNRESTLEHLENCGDAFGDILDVGIGGQYFWTTGLTQTAIDLIGLENLMLYMFDNPDGLKRLMKFLSDDMSNYMDQLEHLDLLAYNNGNNGIGSGNWGLTSQLPSESKPAEKPIRFKHLWGFCESQETVGVSPEMFAEFIWPYQKPLMERFGMTYYGCCEPVEDRFEYIKTVKNLRCISVSPWSKPEKCAELYGRKYVLCCKPNPGLVCVNFSEDAIRKEIRHVLDCAGKLNLMFILKDTHTISNEPARFKRWVDIVRSEIEKG
ncbi:MAG TPA: hypothetical protein DET40_12880 [Lentisphaeria bacterium]|nr:MAG: hypothetical protein A2X45_13805 [Lentisphaerae bacterium GWF2_50_93]HCE44435.1 hypothetical protein [Lentisphaeria bacterium]